MSAPPLATGGLFHASQPASQSDYRASTARHAAFAGVTLPSFICKCCGRRKVVEGRKRVNPKYPQDGYKCADCAKPAT